MRFTDNKELKLLDSASKDFSRKELAPEREENDHYPFGPFFNRVVEKAFELDFFHILLPEDMGGVGHGVAALCVVLDNICREDSSLGGIIFTNTFAQEILLAAGEREILKGVVANAKTVDEFLIACPVMRNPLESPLALKAFKNDDGYYLTGSADYVVLGGLAGHALLPATIDGKGKISYFFVDMADPGITKSDPVVSHGLHACPAVDLQLSRAKGRPVGAIDTGAEWFTKKYCRMQLVAAAMAAGVMKGALNEAMNYCRQRVQGGRRIGEWSEVQMMLADMAVQTQVADLLVQRACQAMENDENGWTGKVQAAALHILSAATQVASDGIQVLGGVGYMKDFGQEKRFRDIGQIQAFLGYFPLKKIHFIKQLM